ncbi:isoprenoid synthase domain-containing protein [Entophlyctis helioformis]|nr:isoprenoid synthase domain-containing protein [Entophlyctis helioformis]
MMRRQIQLHRPLVRQLQAQRPCDAHQAHQQHQAHHAHLLRVPARHATMHARSHAMQTCMAHRLHHAAAVSSKLQQSNFASFASDFEMISSVAATPAPAVPAAKKAKTESPEWTSFMAAFDVLAKDILDGLDQYKLPENGREWVRNMLYATVPGGKMNRGLTVPSAFASIIKRELTADELFQAQVLGWCIELLQAFFLIADDIMDGSITRRGSPCWYRQEGVGMSVIYQLLKKYFKKHAAYGDFLELFHEVTYQTELGQLMDLITAPEGDVDLSRFSIEKHAYIVEYKTAYYSFYLPIALAMRLAGITDESAYAQAQAVLLPLGEYFQVQDDFLDCYGTPEVIGKIGTDIEDNKCGWLIKDAAKVAVVKGIYKDLEIERVYREYEEESFNRISALIEKVDESLLPRDMFVTFMKRIYKRNA